MCRADPRHGRHLACSLLFRGKISPKEMEQEVLNVQNKGSSYFVEWIPANIHCSICDIPPEGFSLHATYLANSTIIQELFKTVVEKSTGMMRRKAFWHWYTSEGMEEMELTQASLIAQDVASEYQIYQDATAEEGSGEFEDFSDY